MKQLTTEEVSHLRFVDMVNNVMSSRSELIQQFLDPRRDVLLECGHPTTGDITPQHYSFFHERVEVATRINELFPKECWAKHPDVYEDENPDIETQFELAWKTMCKRLRGNSSFKMNEGASVWEVMKRADILSGIGQYGVILIGFDDVKINMNGDGESEGLKGPVKGVEEYLYSPPEKQEGVKPKKKDEKIKKPKKKATEKDPLLNALHELEKETDEEEAAATKDKKTVGEEGVEDELEQKAAIEYEPEINVLFLRAFDQNLIQITQYEDDRTSPRFGFPKEYLITFNDPSNQVNSGVGINTTQLHVHWTRVIHLADNLGSSEVFGVPRVRPVYNRVMDLMKLYGGSAEMYWRGAFPGFALETHPQLGGDVEVDTAAIKVQMTDYMNKLQRYISLMGMSAKSLAPQVSDPTAQITVQLDAICIQLGVPKRIFMGSERGELASGQDEDTWTERVKERQLSYVIPRIIVPFIDRLIAAKVLPVPLDGYYVEWPEIDTVTETEKATTAASKTTAMAQYISGGVDALMAPLDYLVKIIGLTEEEAKSILDSAVEHINEANPDLPDVTVPGAHPEPPPPEIPESPIKMKEGESLMAPDGTPLPAKKPSVGKKPPFIQNAQDAPEPTVSAEAHTGRVMLPEAPDEASTSSHEFDNAMDRHELLTNRVSDGSATIVERVEAIILGKQLEEEIGLEDLGLETNYSPSQPRDGRGRFGSGGSGGGGGSTEVEKLGPPDSFKTHATAAEKRDFNRLIKERLQLNKKIAEGNASQRDLDRAGDVKREITGLKKVAADRAKDSGDTPPPKPPRERKKVEKPEQIDEVTDLGAYGQRLSDFLRDDPYLNDIHQKVLAKGTEIDNVINGITAEINAQETELKKFGKSSAEMTAKRVAGEITTEEYKASYGPENELWKVRGKLQMTRLELHTTRTQKMKEVLNVDPKDALQLNSNHDSEVSKWKGVKDGTEFVQGIVAKNALDTLQVNVVNNYGDRERYNSDINLIRVNSNSPPMVIAHEIGHGIEHNIGGKDLPNRFLEMRIKKVGSKDVPMRKFSKFFGDDEVGNEDSFGKLFGNSEDGIINAHYTGKRYSDRSTEVISTGIQELHRDARRFALKDPEYFKFTVGYLHNKLPKD